MKTKQSIDFETLFNPESMAVVGVKDDKFNNQLIWLKEAEKMGFKGKLYAVSKREKIAHYETFQTIIDIPAQVDLVIIGVSQKAVPEVVRDCVTKGVKWVVIWTSGYSETGQSEKRELEQDLVKIAAGTDTRLIGPNCIGPYSPYSGVVFERGLSEIKGEVGLITQSGATGILAGRVAKANQFGFSKVISYGNEADIQGADFLEYLTHDSQTKIIAAYVEGVKDGQRYLQTLKHAASSKPTVILKGGITEAGTRAVSSHTGSLASSRIVWEAVFKKTGAIQVYSFEELIDTIVAFQRLPEIKNSRVALISPSGGAGVMNTDLCIMAGFSVPELSVETQEKLKLVLPPGTSAKNPLDMGGTAYFNRSCLKDTFAALDADPNIDLIMFHLPMDFFLPILEESPWFQNKFLEYLNEFKPISKAFVILMPYTVGDSKREEIQGILNNQGFAVFPTVQRATAAISHNVKYYKCRNVEEITVVVEEEF